MASKEESVVCVYTDGSCEPNPGVGGYGIVVEYVTDGEVTDRETFGGGEEESTNNRMEMMAAAVALEKLKQGPHRHKKIELTSDSNYVVKGVTEWSVGWKKHGWKRQKTEPLANRDLWIRLDTAKAGLDVKWKWVKGHAGHPQNEEADRIADAERRKIAEGIQKKVAAM
jgi:ribonuclease HI